MTRDAEVFLLSVSTAVLVCGLLIEMPRLRNGWFALAAAVIAERAVSHDDPMFAFAMGAMAVVWAARFFAGGK